QPVRQEARLPGVRLDVEEQAQVHFPGHEHRDEEESEDAQRDDIDQYREPHGGHDADDVDPDKDDVGHDEPRHRAVPPWVTGEVQQGLGDVVHQEAHGAHHHSGGD